MLQDDPKCLPVSAGTTNLNFGHYLAIIVDWECSSVHTCHQEVKHGHGSMCTRAVCADLALLRLTGFPSTILLWCPERDDNSVYTILSSSRFLLLCWSAARLEPRGGIGNSRMQEAPAASSETSGWRRIEANLAFNQSRLVGWPCMKTNQHGFWQWLWLPLRCAMQSFLSNGFGTIRWCISCFVQEILQSECINVHKCA